MLIDIIIGGKENKQYIAQTISIKTLNSLKLGLYKHTERKNN